MGDAEPTWRWFANDKRYWCVRPWERGLEIWTGKLGKGGKARARVEADIEAAIEKEIARQQKKGFTPAEPPTKLPKPKQLTKARAHAERAVSPRHLNWLKVDRATMDNKPERLRKIFEVGETDVMVRRLPEAGYEDDEDAPYFFSAPFSGGTELLQVFLDHGADPRVVDSGRTVLHSAAATGQLDCIDLLLEHGASIDQRDGEGRTVMHIAVDSGGATARIVEGLVERGADVGARDAKGQTALHLIARRGLSSGLMHARDLIRNGAPVDAVDDMGDTPLTICEAYLRGPMRGVWGKLAVILREASPNEPEPAPPEEPREELVRLLTTFPPLKPDARSLGDAAASGDVALVRAFLEDGADPDANHRPGFFPLERAHKAGHRDVVALLRVHGADERPGVGVPEPEPASATVAKQLGATIGKKVLDVFTALEPAFDMRPPDRPEPLGPAAALARCVELIDSGEVEDLATIRVGHESLLRFACTRALGPVVHALMHAGVDLQPNHHHHPLYDACVGGSDEIIDALLEAGISPKTGPNGVAPVGAAVNGGTLARVRRLVEAGAVVTDHAITWSSGPQRNAIRRFLRSHVREQVEGSRRRSVKVLRRKNMYTPGERSGTEDHDAYQPYHRLAFARAPIDEVADALAAEHPYARDIAKRALLGVTDGLFVFQLEDTRWTVLAPIGSARQLGPTLSTLSTALGCEAVMRKRDLAQIVRYPGDMTEEDTASFYERVGLWVPPFHVEGEGLTGPGDMHLLVFKGLKIGDFVRVDRLVFVE